MVAAVDSPLSHFTFPRTGKRGVPQQFPRRLYEMLESETNHFEQDPNYKRVISWSESGKAFRIFDVAEFSDSILPKYFRTKKFSSFQRNLNLYGFSKARRGPEMDMYAHPSFLRNDPKSLFKLRKTTSSSRKRLPSDASHSTATTSSARSGSSSISCSLPYSPTSVTRDLIAPIPTSLSIPGGARCDRGKLDLLAMAMEREFAACS